MVYDPNIHNRQSTRIRNFDYSQNGLYFVTIMCKNREHLFGKIVKNEMELNEAGKIANECWLNIPNHFPNTVLHEYVIMPNHVHGIIQIKKNIVDSQSGVDNNQPVIHSSENNLSEKLIPTSHQFQRVIPNSLGSIVRGFKIGVTKWFRINGKMDDVWQRNYHDFVIFDPATFSRIEDYIRNNPKNFIK
jgi:putative transposase